MFSYIFIKANVIRRTISPIKYNWPKISNVFYTSTNIPMLEHFGQKPVYVSYLKCLNPIDNRDLEKYF